MMVGRWVSFWDCLFLGAMLNFRGVHTLTSSNLSRLITHRRAPQRLHRSHPTGSWPPDPLMAATRKNPFAKKVGKLQKRTIKLASLLKNNKNHQILEIHPWNIHLTNYDNFSMKWNVLQKKNLTFWDLKFIILKKKHIKRSQIVGPWLPPFFFTPTD